MPLDEEARQYATELFNRAQKEILALRQLKLAETRARMAAQGTVLSGQYVVSIQELAIETTRQLGKARMDALVAAYERSGLPYDETAHGEISSDVAESCARWQQHEIGFLAQEIQRTFGGNAPPNLQDSSKAGIENGIRGVIADLMSDLRIKRSEVLLDNRRTRKAYAAGMGKHWDVFICHASEDKDAFVRPLAEALTRSGLAVWYDETTLKIGDSLRRAIDSGLANSRFGIVVLSPDFFRKEWPQNELDGLVSREMEGVKLVLPIWHNIAVEELRTHSPLLAGRLAAKSSTGLETVVSQLRAAMGLQ
jgi:TIR domain